LKWKKLPNSGSKPLTVDLKVNLAWSGLRSFFNGCFTLFVQFEFVQEKTLTPWPRKYGTNVQNL
jgi:hypothetical protein